MRRRARTSRLKYVADQETDVTLRAVGFDLDHTLAVPALDRETLLEHALDAVDAPDVSRREYLDAHRENHAAVTRTPIFERALPDNAAVDANALATAYRDRIADAITPIADADALLASLRSTYHVGLLTNGPIRAQGDKLDELEWWSAFHAVQITGQLPAGKPDGRAFDALAAALGVDVTELAYVGDEPEIDVVGAATAGASTIQVVWPDGPAPHPRADAVVDRDALATDLPDVLDELD